MKNFLVFIVLITVLSNVNCRFFDGILGAVKNTTNMINQDILNVVNYGKNTVFGVSDATNKTTKKHNTNTGFIDNVSLKLHDVAVGAREHFRKAISIFDKDDNGNGPIERMFDKMKNKVTNVKGLLFNGNKESDITKKKNSNIELLCEKLKHYIFNKNTTSSSPGVQKTIHSLKEVVNMVRNNITKHKQPNNSEIDGTGLIDIRGAFGDQADNLENSKNNINNAIDVVYDKVDGDDNGIHQTVNNSTY